MSWRLWKPRPIASYEARILRRVLEVDADPPPSAALMASIEHLIVHEEGGGGSHRDCLDFNAAGQFRFAGTPVAMALGTMTNDAPIELIVWARGETITGLELEPFGESTRLPIRMPVLESIRPHPGYGESDEDAEAPDPVASKVILPP
jgi:hypothetical protein